MFQFKTMVRPGFVGIMALGGLVTLIFFGFVLIKFIWGWAIPDLFPGAVEQGLIAGSISWFAAFKLTVLLVVLGGIAGVSKG